MEEMTDHGLYDYITSGISVNDKEEIIVKKIMRGIGVGFDGKKFIFARFIPSRNKLNTRKVKVEIEKPLNLGFIYEIKDFQPGLKRLALLLNSKKREA